MLSNVLIVYYYPTYPCRTAITDHIYSFSRYSGLNTRTINAAVPWAKKIAASKSWDVVIFHNTFLLQRVAPSSFTALRERYAFLKTNSKYRIALPQDENSHTDGLVQFIKEFEVSSVITVAPETEWRTLYGSLIDSAIKFCGGLTGYLDDKTVARVNGLAKSEALRENPVDIGYRSFRATARLGRLGKLKWEIAERLKELVRGNEFSIDVSTDLADTLVGDEWFRFLLRCRYQLGVESGASLIDRDGRIRQSCMDYERANPDASFEEVEAACFPGEDGNIAYKALGPRHLEACLTRSCQILIEGDYNGALTPHVHYIPLKADFSNFREILDSLDDEERRQEMVDVAYRDVVESRNFSYQNYVEMVLSQVGIVCQRRVNYWSICIEALLEKCMWLSIRISTANSNPLARIFGRLFSTGSYSRKA